MDKQQQASDLADELQELILKIKGGGFTVGAYSNSLYIWSATDSSVESCVDM